MRRRYAEDTTVNSIRSKAEVEEMLTEWGCSNVRWTTDNEQNRVRLEFVWKPEEGTAYCARFTVQFPSDEVLKKRARHGRTGYFLPAKYEDMKRRNGWPEMRQLALYIKAALNAIETGIVRAEDVFLPYLVDASGRTVAEIIAPKMGELRGGAGRLLLTEARP